mmetsp:Transcript_2490/g.8941  ORF Transcript_2490/g.8941 Transcript_2490/m.8941 type:complete len:216 (-) Transcript_2490:493-1140(-)
MEIYHPLVHHSYEVVFLPHDSTHYVQRRQVLDDTKSRFLLQRDHPVDNFRPSHALQFTLADAQLHLTKVPDLQQTRKIQDEAHERPYPVGNENNQIDNLDDTDARFGQYSIFQQLAWFPRMGIIASVEQCRPIDKQEEEAGEPDCKCQSKQVQYARDEDARKAPLEVVIIHTPQELVQVHGGDCVPLGCLICEQQVRGKVDAVVFTRPIGIDVSA